MTRIQREYSRFSLCGLNCGLCPMYHISEEKHCTGCGGEGRPSCAIMRCAQQHGSVEYCFQCDEYPCERYSGGAGNVTFITYRNVRKDFEKAKTEGLDRYRAMMDEKVELLRYLLANYNDGRKKSFFCLAVNLLELNDVRQVVEELAAEEEGSGRTLKERAAVAVGRFQALADERGVSLKPDPKAVKK